MVQKQTVKWDFRGYSVWQQVKRLNWKKHCALKCPQLGVFSWIKTLWWTCGPTLTQLWWLVRISEMWKASVLTYIDCPSLLISALNIERLWLAHRLTISSVVFFLCEVITSVGSSQGQLRGIVSHRRMMTVCSLTAHRCCSETAAGAVPSSVCFPLSSLLWISRSSSLTARSCRLMCWETSCLVTRALVSLEVTGAHVLKRRESSVCSSCCDVGSGFFREGHTTVVGSGSTRAPWCVDASRPLAHRSHLRLSIWLHHLNTGNKLARQLNDTRVSSGRVFGTSLFLWAITDTRRRSVCAFGRNHQILTRHRRFLMRDSRLFAHVCQ